MVPLQRCFTGGIFAALILHALATWALAGFGDQIAKLEAPPTTLNDDDFGFDLAIKNGVAAVGAKRWNRQVYLYDATTGQHTATLSEQDAEFNTDFGEAVAFYGDKVLVGARYNSEAALEAGVIFSFEPAGIEAPERIFSTNPTLGAQFGLDLAVTGDRAFTFKKTLTEEGFLYVGSVIDLITGAEFAPLVPGGSLGVEHDNIRLSAGDGLGIVSGMGGVHLFDLQEPGYLQSLSPVDPTPVGDFGSSVAVSSDFAVVGSFNAGPTSEAGGAAYVFDADTGQQLWKLRPDDLSSGDRFGDAVAIDGNYAVVGAPLHKGGGIFGAAYVFDLSTGQQIAKLLAYEDGFGGLLGSAVAIEGQTVLVSAPIKNAGEPAVYVYDLTGRPGDFDGDQFVTVSDYQIWRDQFGQTGDLAADGNGDGVVDVADFTIWRDAFTPTAPAPAALSAPEPSSSIFLLAAVLLTRRRR